MSKQSCAGSLARGYRKRNDILASCVTLPLNRFVQKVNSHDPEPLLNLRSHPVNKRRIKSKAPTVQMQSIQNKGVRSARRRNTFKKSCDL